MEHFLASARSEARSDCSIYGIRAQQHVIDALVAAKARGVVVRGVVDSENSSCTAFGYPDTPSLISALGPGSVVCDTGAGYSYIMHNKFFVFDGAKTWTGSTNISDTKLGGEYNSDVAAMLTSYRIAQIYEAEFAEMYGGLFHNRKSGNTEHSIDGSHFTDGTVVTSYFSPTDHATDNAVLPLINAAAPHARHCNVLLYEPADRGRHRRCRAARRRGCGWSSMPAARATPTRSTASSAAAVSP